jgi:hypothetical protein
LRHFDLGRGCDRLLRLHGAIDADQHLTLTHPITGIGINARYKSTFANDADRHFTPCGQGSGSID